MTTELRSRTAEQLASARTTVAQLEAKKAAEDAAAAAAPLSARQLAVKLHTRACDEHTGAGSVRCNWRTVANYDNPALVDWSEPTHAFFIRLALVALEPATPGVGTGLSQAASR